MVRRWCEMGYVKNKILRPELEELEEKGLLRR